MVRSRSPRLMQACSICGRVDLTTRVARRGPAHHFGGDGEQEFVVLLLDEPPDMADDQAFRTQSERRPQPDIRGIQEWTEVDAVAQDRCVGLSAPVRSEQGDWAC